MLRPFWKRIKRRSLRHDWHAELPSEKSQVFDYAIAQAKPAYVIFSMALNEALMLRRSGKHEMAREQVEVSAELCVRFADTLECLLDVVERHADNFGLLPSVNPLEPLYYVGETAKRAAAMNSLLSTVLFRQHTRFLHKVRTLAEMACKIAEEYRLMTSEVCEGISSKEDWDRLSSLQFDLTTSLSEAIVMIKSFIISLPSGEVLAFRERLAKALLTSQAAARHASERASQRRPAVLDRRASAFRRE
jgi:hypothetical protein